MEDKDALEMIKDALSSITPEREEQFRQLTLDSDMKSLQIDSIRTLEMIGIIEDRLATTFEEQEIAKVKSLRDLVDLICRSEA